MVPPTPPVLPPDVSQIASPLRWKTWEHELHRHPDREYVQFLVDGMRNGFRIGYDHKTHSCKSCAGNMVSARQHPEQVRKYLATEMAEGRIIGPVDSSAVAARIQISCFAVIPKPHQLEKWRLITDLSFPEGSSVNDRIPSRLCSMSYTSVDAAISMVLNIGRGAVMAKFDHIPADTRSSCGSSSPGNEVGRLSVYGQSSTVRLRSAPKLFTAVADALLWIIGSHGIREGIHYLDDFLILGRAGTEECSEGLEQNSSVRASVLLCPAKTRRTRHRLVLLGDLPRYGRDDYQAPPGKAYTITLIKLPQEKLTRLHSLITEWKGGNCAVWFVEAPTGDALLLYLSMNIYKNKNNIPSNFTVWALNIPTLRFFIFLRPSVTPL